MLEVADVPQGGRAEPQVADASRGAVDVDSRPQTPQMGCCEAPARHQRSRRESLWSECLRVGRVTGGELPLCATTPSRLCRVCTQPPGARAGSAGSARARAARRGSEPAPQKKKVALKRNARRARLGYGARMQIGRHFARSSRGYFG